MPSLAARALAGFVLAALIAAAAWRARSLAPSGAVAAIAVGTACVTAGWWWGALLVLFFVVSTLLSRWREGAKLARTGAIVAKGGARDAWQVVANGGLFALAALGALVAATPEAVAAWRAFGVGALAAATADTWATEIGTLARGTPRSILSGRAVPPGTSGGISAPGSLASLAGAGFVALLAAGAGWGAGVAVGALAGGVAGSLADSLLGAGLQARRWCDRCDRGTERMTHDCGTTTRHAGGLAWMSNDVVNLASGAVGAALSLAALALSGRAA